MDLVGYSGTFVSGYKGRNDPLIRDYPTIRTTEDVPWYKVATEFLCAANDTIITLHKELFRRHYEMSMSTDTIVRLRLIVDGDLLPISAIEHRYAWMNCTAKPDEERIITPAGSLVFHSEHQHRSRRQDVVTWRGEQITTIQERTFH